MAPRRIRSWQFRRWARAAAPPRASDHSNRSLRNLSWNRERAMQLNLRSVRFSAHRLAAVATTVVLAVATAPGSSQAQTLPFPTQPVCYAPPAPQLDGWPIAVTDSLGSTAGVAMTFSAASLLSNDR